MKNKKKKLKKKIKNKNINDKKFLKIYPKMNTLLMPNNIDSKEIVQLRYKNQPQKTQKKILDFLVNKNISFYQANPKNFEAIVQIYNISANKKIKSLSKSKSASKTPTSSKSPIKTSNKKGKLLQTPQKLVSSETNINNKIKNSVTVTENFVINEKTKKGTLKKKPVSVSIHEKTKGNALLEELHKNVENEQKDINKIRESQISLKETKGSKTNLIKNNDEDHHDTLQKKKKSFKNDSSMNILQKNKKILDSMINANSVLEFEAKKIPYNKENHESHESHKDKNDNLDRLHKSTKECEFHEQDPNILDKSPNKSPMIGYDKKTNKKKGRNDGIVNRNKASSLAFKQDKSKENLTEKKNSISEKMESNFKQIVSKELSHVPSGEKMNRTSINLQFQKAVQILYERLDLLSSEELIFYYKFIVNKAKKLYLDFLQKRGLIVS